MKGLGSAARRLRDGLHAAGFAPVEDDLANLGAAASFARRPLPQVPPGGVWLSCCNPPEWRRLVWSYGPALAGRYRIGAWHWELERLPADWARTVPAFDELWLPSRFVLDAVRPSAPPHVRLRLVPPPTPDLSDVRADRARFALPERAFVVLAMLDLHSTAARKNPGGVLDAYLQAYPEPGEGRVLCCKVVGAAADPEALANLRRRTAGRPDIRLLTEGLTDAQVWSLIASCDVLLSMSRSEGYGLTLAEAMKLGRCVVATGWSAPVDYLDDACGVLLPFRLVPVVDPSGAYKGRGLRWAEPDVAVAARTLRDLAAQPARVAALGQAARERITAHERRFVEEVAEAPWRSLVASG